MIRLQLLLRVKVLQAFQTLKAKKVEELKKGMMTKRMGMKVVKTAKMTMEIMRTRTKMRRERMMEERVARETRTVKKMVKREALVISQCPKRFLKHHHHHPNKNRSILI